MLEIIMNSIRKIKKVWKSKPTIEGAGVHLKRAFGYNQVPQFDPFLMLDDFRSDTPGYYLKGFPWHPHRGIETITYVLRGDVEHGDSMGNAGVIICAQAVAITISPTSTSNAPPMTCAVSRSPRRAKDAM
jgi:redox-sensitive bicupin YhaK (pirin superfamily)